MKQEKRFIVRKYVMAQTASQAIRLEKAIAPDEVFLDEEWMKQNPKHQSKKVGF